MTYSEEQLEDLLLGKIEAPESMDPVTRRTLAEQRAVRRRLAGITSKQIAPNVLVEQIRNRLARAKSSKSFAAAKYLREIRLTARRLPALAAAAVLLAVVGVWMWHEGPSRTQATQPLMYGIHQANIAGQNDFLAADNPADIAQRLQRKTCMNVKLPPSDGSCEYLGSTLATFRDCTVGGMVCRQNGRRVSVLYIDDKPETFGFCHRFEHQGRTWWRCGYGDCSMVAVRVDDKTFVAVGPVEADALQTLLEKIIVNNLTPQSDSIL